jgi:hypothetical protein
LTERLKKFNLSEGFEALDVYNSLSDDLAPLEETLSLALDIESASKEIILGKALEYKLSPHYIIVLH